MPIRGFCPCFYWASSSVYVFNTIICAPALLTSHCHPFGVPVVPHALPLSVEGLWALTAFQKVMSSPQPSTFCLLWVLSLALHTGSSSWPSCLHPGLHVAETGPGPGCPHCWSLSHTICLQVTGSSWNYPATEPDTESQSHGSASWLCFCFQSLDPPVFRVQKGKLQVQGGGYNSLSLSKQFVFSCLPSGLSNETSPFSSSDWVASLFNTSFSSGDRNTYKVSFSKTFLKY